MWLNCDMGESFGRWRMGLDAQVMPHIDMASIACGFHASDPNIMLQTVALAKQHNVMIGAHPGYPDLAGFGRRHMACSRDEIYAYIIYQLGALQAACRVNQTSLQYVKPHGALYNDMMKDDTVLCAIMDAVHDYDPRLKLMLMAQADNAAHQKLADERGIHLLFEAFADRCYTDDGLLLARTQPGAVLHDEDAIIKQAIDLAKSHNVRTDTGKQLSLNADSICVHGDNAESIQAIKKIKAAILETKTNARTKS